MKMKRQACLAAALVVVGAGIFLFGKSSTRHGVAADAADDVRCSESIAQVKSAVTRPRALTADEFLAALPTNQTASVRGTKPFILTSERSIQNSLRLQIEATGARTVGVLSRNSLVIEATPEVRARLAADKRFTSVTEFRPSRKLAPELVQMLAKDGAVVEVALLTLAEEDRMRVAEIVRASGGEILTGCLNDGDLFHARLTAEIVTDLVGRGDVRWLEPFVRPRLTNDTAVEPAAMNVREVWTAHDLNGAGQNITTSDSGIDTGDVETMHEDLRNQVVGIKIAPGCTKYDDIGHGTHTAGSIVGDGTLSDGMIRGTAWGAKLYAWFCSTGDGGISTPSTLDELFRPDQENYPAYIHSASWGSSQGGKYTAQSQRIDDWTWKHDDFLPVYSAGNDGSGMQTIGSPATAKNLLAVGATQNLRTGYPRNDHPTGKPEKTASFSSRGPCQDGRVKPDIAAPGVGVLSTCTTNAGVTYARGMTPDSRYPEYPFAGYAWECGTSMSCPLTAGAMALVRQWLVERRGFDNPEAPPSSALMKAVVMGGAKGTTSPNNDQGWGRVDLENTLFPKDRGILLVDRIPFDEDLEFSWVIETTNNAPLDVQLVWIDYPGDASAAQASPKLINDLDLIVESADGSLLYGNDRYPSDTENNAESVRVTEAVPGVYQVIVSCANIYSRYDAGGAAALYVRGAFDPEQTKPGTGRVLIHQSGESYRTLDAALLAGADVYNAQATRQPIDIEVRLATQLTQPWTVGYDCNIFCTNANPAQATISALGALSVNDQARVLLTNVVFKGASPGLKALSGGTAALAGTVQIGDIELVGDGQLEMAGALNENFFYRVKADDGHNDAGDTFGCASVPLEVAQRYANLFINKDQQELVGIAKDDGAGGVILEWGLGDLPESAVVAYLAQGGETNKFADLKTLFKYAMKNSTVDADILVRTNCTLEGVMNVSNRTVTIRSENGSVVTSPTGQGSETFAGFTVESDGTLTLSNVVFRGFSQFAGQDAFVVVRTNGTFRMQKEAVLRGIANPVGFCGAVLNGGRMTMEESSALEECASDDGYGGGVYVEPTGELALDGATITGCRAKELGGGVYMAAGAKLTLSGATQVSGNVQKGEYAGDVAQPDDIYAWDLVKGESLSPITVTDEMTDEASVGVRLNSNEGKDRDKLIGTPFATLAAAGMSDERAAKAFFNDFYPGYYGLVGKVGDGELVWAPTKEKPGTVPVSQATIRVVANGVETNYYNVFTTAFDSIGEDDVATVTLLKDKVVIDEESVDAIVPVNGQVTLDGSGFSLYRYHGTLEIGGGQSLVLTNVTVHGVGVNDEIYSSASLVRVTQGGSLTLEDGATLQDVDEYDEYERTAAAIAVYDGTLTMRPGSLVWYCMTDEDFAGGVAGGVIVSGESGLFNFEGGEVTWCLADESGSGVQIENGARIRVSGDGQIVDNVRDNLYVVDTCEVLLADAFTGKIGHTRGVTKTVADQDTNVFGRVAADCPKAPAELIESAANFFKDEDSTVTGRVVTNATEALLVWSSAIQDGAFTAKDGTVYREPIANAVMWPSAIVGLVYNGNAQTGVVAGVGYTLTGSVATNAAYYTAKATLDDGKVWVDGSTGVKEISWEIGRATYDMSGVTFADASFVEDGTVRSLAIVGTLPAGVTVTYEGNGQSVPGTYTVTAKFTGDTVNYYQIDDMTATLTITAKEDPEPDPQWTVVTNQPTDIAFKSIDRVSDTEWALVITDRVEFCNYRLIWTKDLTKGFTSTGEWEQAHAAGPWATNVITTGGAWFWRAEGTEGTNMVPPQVEK